MGNIILVTGLIRDKQINEKLEIDNSPWYQEWGWGLRAHILSDKDTIRFWTLNSNFKKAVKLAAAAQAAIRLVELAGQVGVLFPDELGPNKLTGFKTLIKHMKADFGI